MMHPFHSRGCHCSAILLFLSFGLLQATARHPTNNYVCIDGLDSPGGTVPKGDIVLESGSSLEIFCNLNLSHREAHGRNSSSLVFYRNEDKVPSEFVEIINSTTIRLFKKDPPPATDYYYCKLDLGHNRTGVCLNMVAIGYKPQKVKNFTCISRNWQNLTCQWVKPENPVNTEYKLQFYLPGRAGKRIIYNCPNISKDNLSRESLFKNLKENEELCFWDFSTDPHYRQPYEYYYFEIKGHNQLGDEKFGPMKFHHYAHVIPSPPVNLSAKNVTSNSVQLEWEIPFPMNKFPPRVVHRLLYQSTYDRNKWTQANTTQLPRHLDDRFYYLLNNLKYHNTLYDVRVFLRSALAVGEEKWSQYSFVTFKTKSTIPAAPPETVMGSFEVNPEGVTREVYVYWRQTPPEQYNGDNFHYKVLSVRENGLERQHDYDQTPAYAKFKGLSYNSYEFTIVSRNNIGDSERKSVVYVPSKKDMPKEPVSFTKIAFHDGIYELSWKAPSESPDIETYTVFWCLNTRDRPYQCTGHLDWIQVPASVTMKNITVPDDTKIYQFAIAANTKNASSGMVWASCTVIHNKVVGKMKSVWINRIGSTFIEVGWKLECSDRIGRVEGFQIDFCPIVSPHETTCREPVRNLTLEPSERQFHGNITGLRPYTTYMVTVAIITNIGTGAFSDPLFNTTLEGAPDPPANLTVIETSNTSIIVHWDRPKSMNGVFQHYEMCYKRSVSTHFQCYQTNDENATSFTLVNLTSYETYVIKVAACTGQSCSVPAEIVEAKTKIGNPGKMERPAVRFLNSSQVLLTWRPPTVSGGVLNYYQVAIQQSDGERNTSTHFYNSTGTEAQIVIPECTKDVSRVKYTFIVRAVNRDEDGQVYYGPWSETGEANCYAAGLNLAAIVTLYIVGFLLVTAVCIFFVYSGKRVWKIYKDMKRVVVKLPPGLETVHEKEKDQDFPIDVTWSADGLDHHLTCKVQPSADEELLLKKKKEERHGRNPSGDSSGCSSGHESVSSSLTSGTQISSDSGTEVDQRPPSPDGVFEDSPWDSTSLRLRKASSSVARSTPNLTDMEGVSSGQHFCMGGAWSSTGYISMPSSEEVGDGGEADDNTSYCRVGLDDPPAGATAAPPQAQLAASKGYVVLPNMAGSSPASSASTPQATLPSSSSGSGRVPSPAARLVASGYVSHQLPWASPKESPNEGYVMAGELGDPSSRKSSPTPLMVMELDDNQSILDLDAIEGDVQTAESYCRFGLCPVQPGETTARDTEGAAKPSSGYVTLGEGSHSRPRDLASAAGGSGSQTGQGQRVASNTAGYVPHRHFEKRDTIPLASSVYSDQTDESYTNMFPNTDEAKSPTTNV